MRQAPWPQRFDIVEAFLLSRLMDSRTTSRPEVAQAWEAIRTTHGTMSVEDLAASVGLSRRHLQTLMRQEIGLTPKHAARVARFEHSRSLLSSGLPLAQASALAGFSDQSHLNREWRSMAGMTPRELGDDFPIIQDSYEGDGAG